MAELVGMKNALLLNLKEIAKENDPQTKLTPAGFLKLLLDNNATTEITNADELRAGNDQEVKVRYLQRGLESEVGTVDDCEANTVSWKTQTLGQFLYRKIGVAISDNEFHAWEKAATGETVDPGIFRGLYVALRSAAIALLGSIDSALVAEQATKWGGNAAYASTTGTNPTAAQSLSIGTELGLNDGVVKLQEDALVNEFSGDLLICGSGLVTRYDLYQQAKKANDQYGIGSLPLKSYYDPRTAKSWGANHFGAFAKGTIGLVELNRYVGAYAGQKGTSLFFTIPFPTEINGTPGTVVFDAQLKYNDCPVYDGEGHVVEPRGYRIILSKNFQLWNLPTDAYKTGDVLNGVNGSLHYVATAK